MVDLIYFSGLTLNWIDFFKAWSRAREQCNWHIIGPRCSAPVPIDWKRGLPSSASDHILSDPVPSGQDNLSSVSFTVLPGEEPPKGIFLIGEGPHRPVHKYL